MIRPTIVVDNVGKSYRLGARRGNEVTFREALIHSANAATVRVSRAVGERNVIAVAHKNGIVSPLSPVPAIALGALEVTPIELVTAYAPFANGGWRVRPRMVRRIETPDATVIWTGEIERIPVMDPRDAYELTSMLRSVNSASGWAAKPPNPCPKNCADNAAPLCVS